MKSPNTPDKRGGSTLRFILGLALLLLIPMVLLAQQQGPAWWYQTPSGAQGPVNATGTANDYAAVNQGQLKNMATAAAAEFDTLGLSGLFDSLIAAWQSSTTANNYAAVNLGQLKTVAQPFYDSLIANGYLTGTNQYPWATSGNPANDYAMANIGQVKNLFSFRLPAFVAQNQSVTTSENNPVTIQLAVAGSTTLVICPTSGTLSGGGASYTYAPNANFSGSDSFVYQAAGFQGGWPAFSTGTVSIAVTHVDQPPQVNAGPDQAICISDTATLTGSATLTGTVTDADSLPPLNATVTSLWTVDSGPGPVTFASATSAATTATFSSTGTYVLRLIGTCEGITRHDTVMIVVNPNAGNANPGGGTPGGTQASQTTIAITSPTNGATCQLSSTIQLSASATTTGTVTQVGYFDKSTSLGHSGTAPYVASWIPSVSGTYNLNAIATMSDGSKALSLPVQVIVTGSKGGGGDSGGSGSPTIIPTPPVQSYPAIDATAAGSSGSPIQVALGDDNSFAYSGTDSSNCYAYTFSNGSSTLVNGLSLSTTDSTIFPGAVTTNGDIYACQLFRPSYNENTIVASGYTVTKIIVSGDNGAYYTGLSPTSAGFVGQFCQNPVLQKGPYGVVIANGNTTLFTTSSGTSGVASPNGGPFYPFTGNINGWALGPSGDAFYAWDGSFYPLAGNPFAINDSNQIIGNDWNGGNGYIWQNGNYTYLSSLIPSGYQDQIDGSSISARLLSNANANTGLIYILFNATFSDPNNNNAQSTQTFVLSGTATSLSADTWTIAEVQLASGESTADIQCINANGVLACINSNASSNNASMVKNAMLANNSSQSQAPAPPPISPVSAVPPGGLTLNVKNISSTGWTEQTGDGSTYSTCSKLRSQGFYLAAWIKAISGTQAAINILQDAQSAATITYDDGSSTSCALPNFMPDTNPYNPVVQTGVDANGNIGCTWSDQPGLPFSAGARQYLSSVVYSGTLKDFVTVQLGSGPLELTMELKWSFSMSATFGPNDMTTPQQHFQTKYLGCQVVPTPQVGATISGTAPVQNDSPAWPRPQTGNNVQNGNDYLRTSANWSANGGSGSAAQKYPCPLLSPM